MPTGCFQNLHRICGGTPVDDQPEALPASQGNRKSGMAFAQARLGEAAGAAQRQTILDSATIVFNHFFPIENELLCAIGEFDEDVAASDEEVDATELDARRTQFTIDKAALTTAIESYRRGYLLSFCEATR